MAIMRPPLEECDRLITPLNDGERRVAEKLSELDDEWTVYVQPRLARTSPTSSRRPLSGATALLPAERLTTPSVTVCVQPVRVVRAHPDLPTKIDTVKVEDRGKVGLRTEGRQRGCRVWLVELIAKPRQPDHQGPDHRQDHP